MERRGASACPRRAETSIRRVGRRWRLGAGLAILVHAVAAAATTASAASAVVFFARDNAARAPTHALLAQTAFHSALDVFGTQDLEAFAGQARPTLSFGATGVTATTTFDGVYAVPFSLAVSGSAVLVDGGPADAGGAAHVDTLSFSQGVSAFGAFFVQAGDGPANHVALRFENTATGMVADLSLGLLGPDWPFANVFYLGVSTSDPFDRLSLIESYDYDGILLDNITVGSSLPFDTLSLNVSGPVTVTLCPDFQAPALFSHGVPEPGSAAIMISTIAALACTRLLIATVRSVRPTTSPLQVLRG